MGYILAFTNMVWIYGDANSRNYVTALVDSDKGGILLDRYLAEFYTLMSSKIPSWVLHGMLYNDRKAIGTF